MLGCESIVLQQHGQEAHIGVGASHTLRIWMQGRLYVLEDTSRILFELVARVARARMYDASHGGSHGSSVVRADVALRIT